MNELTQLQRAQHIAKSFEPTEPSQNCYCYVFLGQASWDATSYEELDGQYLMSRRAWHVDETRNDCVCYAGRGQNGRIDQELGHPVLPSSHLRIKLKSGLSYSDSIDLERQLIQELGCICDANRDDGCLVNLRYYESGPLCCPFSEAAVYKFTKSSQKGSAASAVDVIAMTDNRTIVLRGSASWLARELSFNHRSIIASCRQQRRGIWQSSVQRALYFCYAQDYEIYKIKPMTTQKANQERILIVVRLDGSDIFSGTASEVAEYAPEIKDTSPLHKVAQGKQKTAYGFIARYADEISDVPIAAAFPNLNTFV